MAFHAIIPSRYSSTRLPAKALADICGKPMFWHVYNQANKCKSLESIHLATDDERIFEAATKLNVPVLMTNPDHQSGTDRVFEAATILNLPDDSVIVNIQGDEPCLDPIMLDELISPFIDNSINVSTLATKITAEQANIFSQVKVVLDKNDFAIYFSRSKIPYSQNESDVEYLGHIGLYAFRMASLKKFVSLDVSRLESQEKLEQLRLLENGIKIKVVETELHSLGVDTPEDLETIRRKMSENYGRILSS